MGRKSTGINQKNQEKKYQKHDLPKISVHKLTKTGTEFPSSPNPSGLVPQPQQQKIPSLSQKVNTLWLITIIYHDYHNKKPKTSHQIKAISTEKARILSKVKWVIIKNHEYYPN